MVEERKGHFVCHNCGSPATLMYCVYVDQVDDGDEALREELGRNDLICFHLYCRDCQLQYNVVQPAGNASPVGASRYHDVISYATEHKMVFTLMLEPIEIGLISGALRLTLMHPGVRQFSDSFFALVEKLRGFCRESFLEMGFTEDEVESLQSTAI